MGRCKDCKWWNNSTDNWERGRCSCPKMLYGYFYKLGEIPEDCAHIEDDEGWGMRTGPMFGCIHQEVKKLLDGNI